MQGVNHGEGGLLLEEAEDLNPNEVSFGTPEIASVAFEGTHLHFCNDHQMPRMHKVWEF